MNWTPEGPVLVEETGRRVRTYLGGELVADTTRARLVWDFYFPSYYLPEEDVRHELLTPSGTTAESPALGQARYFTVKGGGRVAEDAAWQYPESPVEEIRRLVRLDWKAMDAWFEEDEEVLVHPRDPYHRVDILTSSRHVEVVVNGVKVADSHQPLAVFETGVRTRWYLPLVDVRMDLLRPSATSSGCPYKGVASYWSLEVGGEVFEDLVWGYKTPILESIKLAGRACVWAERSDQVELLVDGVRQ